MSGMSVVRAMISILPDAAQRAYSWAALAP
jgi:hypothetical protein